MYAESFKNVPLDYAASASKLHADNQTLIHQHALFYTPNQSTNCKNLTPFKSTV